MKTPIVTAAALLFMGTAALAQTAPATDGAAMTDAAPMDANTAAVLVEIPDSTILTAWNMSVEDAEDADLYDAQGMEIGEIERIVGTTADMPTAVVVDFEDDTMYGEGDRLVPIEAFGITDQRVTLSADADATTFTVLGN